MSSRIFIAGIAGFAAIAGLALLPQMSTASATGERPANGLVADASEAGAGSAGSSLFAPALAANRDASYRSCFMKRSVSFTADGPKVVTQPTCAE